MPYWTEQQQQRPQTDVFQSFFGGGMQPLGGMEQFLGQLGPAPSPSPVADMLRGLGVDLPEGLNLGTMGLDDARQHMTFARQLGWSPEQDQAYFQDPGNAVRTVMTMWKDFNSMVRETNPEAPPVGLMTFVEQFNPQIKEHFKYLFQQM